MSDQKPIRVMIVDDHPMVRDGLKVFLSVAADMKFVGEAESGEQALLLCDQIQPDVVLMDMVLPGIDGAEATRAIRNKTTQVQVIALTSFENDDLVHRAVQAGAIGYLLKNVPMEKLTEAIRTAHAGQPVLAPEAMRALIEGTTQPAVPAFELTGREQDVLTLMAKGRTNAGIARELHISESTTRFHVSNVLSKLGVSNRTAAVRLALEHRLIS